MIERLGDNMSFAINLIFVFILDDRSIYVPKPPLLHVHILPVKHVETSFFFSLFLFSFFL